ncbi:ATP-binding protein [Solidesulfovibrio carbinolicus]|uniref:Sensory/regulatory protein RpfC n=1 Tax=Solidesulfovibrio carbinolicus TaxID=296842 RepID=A0A4P6HLT1_9BACT|nr:ATP-binding protein [Solidesulfovibrio carbinolicus]QAZ68111.1 hybrid sensor histidine kinase/response regulator [Solidesulfovibrio carbinolicus]
MTWRRLESLRTRLLWLVALTLAPVLALHVASAVEKQRSARAAVDRGLHSIADLAAGNARSLLEDDANILRGIARIAVIRSGAPEEASLLLTDALAVFPSFKDLILVRPDGTVTAASAQPDRPTRSLGDRPWLRQALDAPAACVIAFGPDTIDGAPGLVLAQAVRGPDDTLVGVCALTLAPDWFAAIFRDIRMPQAARACLFSEAGTVLTTWPPKPQAAGKTVAGADVVLPRLYEAASLVWTGQGPDDEIRRAVFAPVAAPGGQRLFIRLSQPQAIHEALLLGAWQRDMLLFGLAVALALAAAWWFNRAFLLRPMGQFVTMAQDMAAGNLDRRSGLAESKGEMGELGRALDAMADKLEERIRFTQELIDAIPAPIFYKDLEGRYLGCNAAYERAIRPLPRIRRRTVHELELPAQAALCAKTDRAVLSGEAETVEYETSLIFSDQTAHDVVVFKSRFHDVAGRTAGVIGVLLDITGRKRSEAELLASRTRYKLLLDSMGDGFVVMSSDFRLVESNPAFQEMTGYGPDELTAMTYHDITPEAWHEPEQRLLAEVDAKGSAEVFEKEYRRKDGTILPVAVRPHRHPESPGEDRRYFAVVRDIADVKAIEADLRQAKEAAETANRAKSDFLAKMSHEIRTPLHAVIGMTELTLGTELSPQQRDALETAREAAGNLLGIINDVLDLSRIEAKGLELVIQDFDLRRTLAGVARTLRPQAARKGLFLTLAVAPNTPRHVRGDQGRVRQILLNLVGNAVKFTREGGVTVTVAAPDGDPGQLELAVADTGIGIAPDRLERIFDMFTQADRTVALNFGGTGLGLAICRELVRSMGGEIAVDSVPGQGTVFRVRLRLTPAQVVPTEPARRPVAAPQADASPLRVLVAEDNPINVKVATTFLSRRGHQTTVAANGARALECLGRETFDLVLMDVEMPELDGMEATRRLRAGLAGEANRCVPVAAMTAHALAGSMERCLAAGMTEFLPKPLDFALLAELLARVASNEAGPAVAKPAAQATPETAAVLEREAALRRLGGDEALLAEVEEDFLRQYPRKLRLIRLCSDAENWEEAALAAHSLKNVAGAVGAEAARRLAGQLEDQLRRRDAEAAHETGLALKKNLDEAAAAIRSAKPTLGNAAPRT